MDTVNLKKYSRQALRTPGFRHWCGRDGALNDIEFVTKNQRPFLDLLRAENLQTHLIETSSPNPTQHAVLYVKKEKDVEHHWLFNPLKSQASLPQDIRSLEHYVFTAADFDKLREKGLIVPIVTKADRMEMGIFAGNFVIIQLGLQTLPAHYTPFNVLIALGSALLFSYAYYAAAKRAFEEAYARFPNASEERALLLEALRVFTELMVTTLAFEALPLSFAIFYRTVLPALHLIPQAHAIFFAMMLGTALIMGAISALRLYFSERNALAKPTSQEYALTFGKHFLIGFLLAAATLFPAFLGIASHTAFGYDIVDAGSYWLSIGLGSLLFAGTLGAMLKKPQTGLKNADQEGGRDNASFSQLSRKVGFWRSPTLNETTVIDDDVATANPVFQTPESVA